MRVEDEFDAPTSLVRITAKIPHNPQTLALEYFNRIDGVFIVFDLHSLPSFEALHHWANLMRSLQRRRAIFVVGVSYCSMPLCISLSDSELLHEPIVAPFIHVNILTGENARAAFVLMAKRIMSHVGTRNREHMRRSVSHFVALQAYSTPELAVLPGATPTSTPRLERHNMFRAVSDGNTLVLKDLLKSGVNINVHQESTNDTLLHLAVLRGETRIVEFLLEHGANPRLKNTFGETPLHLSATSPAFDVMRTLIEHGADANVVDSHGNTPLLIAAQYGHVLAIRYLRMTDADFAVKNDVGNGAVAIAAYWGHTELLRYLHEVRLSFGQANLAMECPFENAAGCGHLEALKTIADIKKPSTQSLCRALLVASTGGHLEMVTYLVGLADVMAHDPSMVTSAIFAALYNNHEEVALYFLENDDISPRWDCNTMSYRKDTALHVAVDQGMIRVVTCLLGKGANVNIANARGLNCALIAARNGFDKLLKELVSRGADPQARDFNQYDALMLACANDHAAVIQVLLEMGMHPNLHSRNGESALMVAVGQGSERAIHKLLDHLKSSQYARDPLGNLTFWSKGPYLQVVTELNPAEFRRTCKLSKRKHFTILTGTYRGLDVLAWKFHAPVDINRFAYRMSLVSHLRHRNLITFLGAFSEDALSYTMLFDNVSQKTCITLYDLLHQQHYRFAAIDMLILMREILNGLAELHTDSGGKPYIVHRDIRSANILLNERHGPIIFNFETGVHYSTALHTFDPTSGSVMIPPAGRIGTMGWIAPEVLSGQPFDGKIDVFSFGMLVFEMYEGKRPFEDYHAFDIPRKIIKGDRPKLRPPRSEAEKSIVDLIERCWAHSSALRPTFSELQRLVAAALARAHDEESALEEIYHTVKQNAVGAVGPFDDWRLQRLGEVPTTQVSRAALIPSEGQSLELRNTLKLYRYSIDRTEYYVKEIPMSVVHRRRLRIFQLRASDIEELPTMRDSNLLKLLYNDVRDDSIRLVTHRYDYVLYDKLRRMASETKAHFSPLQIQSMCMQIVSGLQFLVSQDPPVHHCISDKDIFVRERKDGNVRLMIGDFGLTYLLVTKLKEGMIGEPGFIAPEVLQSSTHRFNTVTDRNHALTAEASDVFAFGMVLSTILQLHRPFDNELSPNDCVRQEMQMEPFQLSSTYQELVDLCLKCTQYRAKLRPTLQQVMEMLKRMKRLSKHADKYRPKLRRTKTSFVIQPQGTKRGIQDESVLPISLPIHKLTPGATPFLSCSGYRLECGGFLVNAAPTNPEIEADSITADYAELSKMPHAFLTGVGPKGPAIAIISKEKSTYREESVYRALIRTPNGDERCYILASTRALGQKKNPQSVPTGKQLLKALYTMLPKYEKFNFRVVSEQVTPLESNVLANLEAQLLKRRYTIGVLYARRGQTTANEMLSNEHGSAAFDTFLHTLGESVRLNQFVYFAGGLDCKYDSTGTHSVYARLYVFEIMLHVSTMLPFDIDDPFQMQRKRFLSQNVGVIVFQEDDSTPLRPDLLAEWDMNHVVAIVRPVKARTKPTTLEQLIRTRRGSADEEEQESKRNDSFQAKREKLLRVYYQVAFAWKTSVNPFSPHLENPLFERGPFFRNFLLTKMVNGERSAYGSDTPLRVEREVNRGELMKELEYKMELAKKSKASLR